MTDKEKIQLTFEQDYSKLQEDNRNLRNHIISLGKKNKILIDDHYIDTYLQNKNLKKITTRLRKRLKNKAGVSQKSPFYLNRQAVEYALKLKLRQQTAIIKKIGKIVRYCNQNHNKVSKRIYELLKVEGLI